MYKVCGTDGAQIHYVVYHVKSYLIEISIIVYLMNSRRACRLQQCLSIEMQRELLRASHCRQKNMIVKFFNGFPSIYGLTIVDDSINIAQRTDIEKIIDTYSIIFNVV